MLVWVSLRFFCLENVLWLDCPYRAKRFCLGLRSTDLCVRMCIYAFSHRIDQRTTARILAAGGTCAVRASTCCVRAPWFEFDLIWWTLQINGQHRSARRKRARRRGQVAGQFCWVVLHVRGFQRGVLGCFLFYFCTTIVFCYPACVCDRAMILCGWGCRNLRGVRETMAPGWVAAPGAFDDSDSC